MKQLTFFIIAFFLGITACKKDKTLQSDASHNGNPHCIPLPNRPMASLAEAQKNQLTEEITFTYGPHDGIVTKKNGTHLFLGGGTLVTEFGDEVDGDVLIRITEIFSREEMALANKPTIAQVDGEELELLQSGGEFVFEFEIFGTPLTIVKPIRVLIPTENTGNSEEGMQVFYENSGPNEQLLWEVDDQEEVTTINFQIDDNAPLRPFYRMTVFPSDFQWINCDKFYRIPEAQKTEVLLDLPPVFNLSNSSKYISIDGEKRVLGGFNFQDGAGQWSTRFTLPIGKAITILVYYKVDKQLYFGKIETVITPGQVNELTAVEAVSEEELKQALKDLP